MAEREVGGQGAVEKGSLPRTVGMIVNTRLEKSQETIEMD